jgi:hypothetical protein
MTIEHWIETHQIVTITVGVGVSLFAKELRAFFASAPGNLMRGRDAYRAAILYRLEQYKEDPATIYRYILTDSAFALTFMTLVGLWAARAAISQTIDKHPIELYIAEYSMWHFAAIQFALEGFLAGVVNSGAITLLFLWLYRDPDRRITTLRLQLKENTGPKITSEA